MDDRDLRKLNRQELLEVLLELTQENEELKAELEKTNRKLQSKRIALEEAGNIAEASLRLNRVFEAAQNAADQYIKNLQLLEKVKKQEVKKVLKLRKQLDETENS